MLISHRKKFIYTKTQKTAGTSVEVYFEKYCMPDGEWHFSHERNEYESDFGIIGFRGRKDNLNLSALKWYNHMPSKDIKNLVGEEIWNDYFKFCVIRNPFERILSYFFFMVVYRNNLYGSKEAMIKMFRDWVKSQDKIIGNDRSAYLINGKICLDFFIKYENLLEDINDVCQKLDIEFEQERLPKLKSDKRPVDSNIIDYYDQKTRDKILKQYAFEFDFFNYGKEIR